MMNLDDTKALQSIAASLEKILPNAANEAIDACGFPGVTAQTVWGGGPEKSAKKGKKK